MAQKEKIVASKVSKQGIIVPSKMDKGVVGCDLA
jgi:hypothetical protein